MLVCVFFVFQWFDVVAFVLNCLFVCSFVLPGLRCAASFACLFVCSCVCLFVRLCVFCAGLRLCWCILL